MAVPGGTLGSGTVAPDGSFAILLSGAALVAGGTVEAHSGSPTGPSQGSAPVVSGGGATPTPVNPMDGGATVLVVTGQPGELITIVNPGTGEVLGSATVPASGVVGITLDTPAAPGSTLNVVSNGQDTGATVLVGPSGAPAGVTQGTVLTEGSTLTGTGTPGSSIQIVDDQGRLLGSATVQADGSWTVPVSGAVAGVGIKVVQDGVARALPQQALTLGNERVFLNTNVFRPLQGGSLDVGFKANADERVTVKVFNIAGETVRTVAEIEVRRGVLYALRWDGKNDASQTVSAGVYIVSVYGPNTRILKKVVILK